MRRRGLDHGRWSRCGEGTTIGWGWGVAGDDVLSREADRRLAHLSSGWEGEAVLCLLPTLRMGKLSSREGCSTTRRAGEATPILRPDANLDLPSSAPSPSTSPLTPPHPQLTPPQIQPHLSTLKLCYSHLPLPHLPTPTLTSRRSYLATPTPPSHTYTLTHFPTPRPSSQPNPLLKTPNQSGTWRRSSCSAHRSLCEVVRTTTGWW